MKTDIEEIMEECSKLAKEANWTKEDTNRVITEYREMEAKANKYDSLVEKMKDKIEWLSENILENDYASDKDKDIAEYQVNALQELLDTEKPF